MRFLRGSGWDFFFGWVDGFGRYGRRTIARCRGRLGIRSRQSGLRSRHRSFGARWNFDIADVCAGRTETAAGRAFDRGAGRQNCLLLVIDVQMSDLLLDLGLEFVGSPPELVHVLA